MAGALLVARLALAAVFATAGVAKLLTPSQSGQAMVEFGIPPQLASVAARLLPVAELVTAGLLLGDPTAVWGSAAALVLLLAFTAVVVANLAQGRAPDCHCFGQLRSAPIRPTTIVRNGLLAAPAILIAWRGPGSHLGTLGRWVSDVASPAMAVSVGVLVIVVVQGWFIVQLMRQQGRLLLRLEVLEGARPEAEPEGLPLGVVAPEFALAGPTGQTRTLDELRGRGQPVMVVFTSSNCPPCRALLPELARWEREWQDDLTVAVVADQLPQDHANGAPPALALLVDGDDAVSRSYRVGATPSAVVVGVDGTVQSPTVSGGHAIRELGEHAVEAARQANGHVDDASPVLTGVVDGHGQ
jgi:thiol-disulfide isomerase/thioredoxin/uncharacterized membrane protein YphA (DoxX/SURF4 family)